MGVPVKVHATLIRDECVEAISGKHLRPGGRLFDVVFADPPYFLSNGGTTCRSGRRAKVDKGDWDAHLSSIEAEIEWSTSWISAAMNLLKPSGTIWITGTMHSIPAVGVALQRIGARPLNWISWEKPNPPPNLGCRSFTHSTEILIWASRSSLSVHHFDYQAMKAVTGKQMKDVWRMTAPGKSEKGHGKHPTQKPLELLRRCLTASCPPGGRVLDPFCGSGTTGVAAVELGMDFVGIDSSPEYVDLAKARIGEMTGEWMQVGPSAWRAHSRAQESRS